MASGRELIAQRAAKFFKDGQLVNLGIGMPTMIPNYLPEGVNIILQSENGYIGIGPAPEPGTEDKDLTNAGGVPSTIIPGGMCFDSSFSFALIRGGHVDVTVLGALEVDEEGNLANYMIPGKIVPGMGGAMDLVAGANQVIITMEHTDKKGNPKIMKKCRLPLTAVKRVNYIITDMCLIEVTDKGLVLLETAPDVSVEEVQAKTEAILIIPEKVGCMA